MKGILHQQKDGLVELETSKAKSGRLNASITEITLHVTLDRTMHEQYIACFIDTNKKKGQTRFEHNDAL